MAAIGFHEKSYFNGLANKAAQYMFLGVFGVREFIFDIIFFSFDLVMTFKIEIYLDF